MVRTLAIGMVLFGVLAVSAQQPNELQIQIVVEREPAIIHQQFARVRMADLGACKFRSSGSPDPVFRLICS